MLESLGLDSIVQSIESVFDVNSYINAGATFLTNLGIIEKLGVGVAAAIIVFLGTFELLKKLSKLFVIVAVLAGLYLLYQGNVFDGIIG